MKESLLLACLLMTFPVLADVMTDVGDVQKSWAEANYQLKDKAQKEAFEDLMTRAETMVQANPASAEALIWRGIVSSTYAGVKGGLGALSLAKSAKADFEQALKTDDKALNGSAYTSLGTLYFKVPGWPIAFGDSDKAEELLKKALTMNPNGIDSNYFYGVFLQEQRDYEDAERYLLKAQQAPARPDRPLADQGRQQEISKALEQVRYQLKAKQQHAGFIN